MVYILEVKLSVNKYLKYALLKIYGIGLKRSFFLCKTLGFSSNLKVLNLSNDQIIKIIRFLESSKLKLNNELKKFNTFLFKKLVNIKAYRGLRKLNSLPIRGQRTHTNSKTAKQLNRFR